MNANDIMTRSLNNISDLVASSDLSREYALARDAADPLAGYRDMFALPDDVIYLDGLSRRFH